MASYPSVPSHRDIQDPYTRLVTAHAKIFLMVRKVWKLLKHEPGDARREADNYRERNGPRGDKRPHAVRPTLLPSTTRICLVTGSAASRSDQRTWAADLTVFLAPTPCNPAPKTTGPSVRAWVLGSLLGCPVASSDGSGLLSASSAASPEPERCPDLAIELNETVLGVVAVEIKLKHPTAD